MLQPGATLQQRYRIERLLGEGGMGRVYLATHLKLGRPVAVKELRAISTDPREQRQYVEQFETEARILSSLDHPNVARVLDYFEDLGNPYFVLEFIHGRTLEQVMELAPRGLTQRKALEWADQVLSALEYLHGRTPPVIIKDLNPRNVMLDAEGRLKIIDFGLAKLMAPGAGTREIVRSMGSEGYAPLEQYGQRPTDQRSDLYALGATILFLLTKSPPPAPPQRLMQSQALPDPRAVNPTVTPQVWTALQLLLSVEPEGRPRSAGEARNLLGLGPRPPAQAPPPTGRPHAAPAQPVRPAAAAPPRRPATPPPPAPGPMPSAGRAQKVRPCPDCLVPLRAVRRLGVEIDVCPRCQGVWLDRGELERLLEQGRLSQAPGGPQRPKGLFGRVLDYLDSP